MKYTGYRHIFYNPRSKKYQLWTWDKKTGERICVEKPFRPFLYVESSTASDAISIYNTNLKKINFDNSFERNKFVKQGGISRIFYNIPPEQQILIEEFGKNNQDINFSAHPLKIFYLDIETFSPNEFPEPSEANDPINLITIYDSLNDEYHTWGLKNDFYPKRDNQYYHQCFTEVELLRNFLKYWAKDYPDIVVGWNSENFDIPYIINRINNVLGPNSAEKLSPIRSLYKRDNVLQQFGKYGTRWYIRGVSCLDYLDIYKTFSRDKQENYKLDHIAEVELGYGKLDYESSNLSNLSIEDWDKYVEYNIHDVKILVELETKLQFIKLIRMLAYMGMTNFESALGTVSIVTGALAVEALTKKNMIIPTFPIGKAENYTGGYVKEPLKGMHECVVSFDANSLYPNTIISLNISPETKIGNIIGKNDTHVTIRLINGKIHNLTYTQFAEFIKKELISISKAKVMYTQKHKGFCPELIDRIYAERVKDKKRIRRLKLEKQRLLEELKHL